jgi:hypothetical protein
LILKEAFVLLKLVFAPTPFTSSLFVTEESVTLFQAATDAQWGVGCSEMMKAVSIHTFDRHYQIMRSTAFRMDGLIFSQMEWLVVEKTGNVKYCIDINDRKIRTVESYIRAAPPPHNNGYEIPNFLGSCSSFVGMETHHQHLRQRRDISRFFGYAGINSIEQAEEGYRSSAEYVTYKGNTNSTADGLTHRYHEHAVVSLIRAVLSFSETARAVELNWLDDLPPADATTLHCAGTSSMYAVLPRVLVAEVFEQQDRHTEAIRFAQTDLQDYHNLSVVSKVRAGRVLGRCHAALGQHMLSVSAFDAAIGLARSRKLLLSEALSVRGRAATGRNRAGDQRLHWDEETGKQRLAEVMGRMQGPWEALERALALS